MNADGSGQAKLTDSPMAEDSPAWSPDSRRIVFRAYDPRGGSLAIWLMNADGSGHTLLTDRLKGAWMPGLSPVWSPDGGRIAFMSEQDGNREIYVIEPDGSGETNLSDHAEEDMEPDWCP
jgi:TolB protein